MPTIVIFILCLLINMLYIYKRAKPVKTSGTCQFFGNLQENDGSPWAFFWHFARKPGSGKTEHPTGQAPGRQKRCLYQLYLFIFK